MNFLRHRTPHHRETGGLLGLRQATCDGGENLMPKVWVEIAENVKPAKTLGGQDLKVG